MEGDERTDDIPLSMQLIAGRTGQEYDIRKGRRGAFWEDRYHATAVENLQAGTDQSKWLLGQSL